MLLGTKIFGSVVHQSFGSAIKSVRKSRGLSQDELGAMIGLNKSQISRIENGRCRSLTTIDEILSALKLSPVIELKPIRKDLSLVEVLNVLREFKMILRLCSADMWT